MSPALLRRMTLGLVALLCAWGLLAVGRRSQQDRTVTMRLPPVDTAAVDTIDIRRGNDAVVISRDAGHWRINGFRASSDAITALMMGLADSRTELERVAENAASHARLGVDTATGRRVRVTSHGRTVLDIVTGTPPTGGYGGLLVRYSDAAQVFAAPLALAAGLAPRTAEEWRDKRVVGAAVDSIAAIEIQRGSRSYSLRRDATGWRFANNAMADSHAVSVYVGGFPELKATELLPSATGDSIRRHKAFVQLTLAAEKGRVLERLVFDSSKTGVFARADTGGTVFRIEPWMLARLAPADTTLRPPKGARR